MSPRTIGMSDEIRRYILESSRPEHPVLARLREETAALGPIARMQIGPEQGSFLSVITTLLGASSPGGPRALEIGTFTGYSSTAMALAGARVLTCDVSADYTAMARRAWQHAGVADRVELVRPGGAILVDNVLWGGRVIDPAVQDEDTQAIRRLNGKIREDVRVAMAMLGAFDGLTIAIVLPQA